MTTDRTGADGLAAQLRHAAADAARVAVMTERLRAVSALLRGRGLKVVIRPPGITVSNPAVPAPSNPHDGAMSPAVAESVLLCTTDSGLVWCWLRGKHGPGEARLRPEVETLCPGDDIDQAARRIAHLMSLRRPGSGRARGSGQAAPLPRRWQQ
jgi:hypothetical protein